MSTQSIRQSSQVFPEFFRLQTTGELNGAKLLGAECVFKSHDHHHPRWRSSLFGNADYAMRVAAEVMDIGPLHLSNTPSSLSEESWRCARSGVVVRLAKDTGADCRVIGFYSKGKEILAAEFEFDAVKENGVVDTLTIYQLRKDGTAKAISSTESAPQEHGADNDPVITPSSSIDFGKSLKDSTAASIAQRLGWFGKTALQLVQTRPAPGGAPIAPIRS